MVIVYHFSQDESDHYATCRYESIIATLCENLDTLDEPEAKASMIWIIGEYAERIDNADELLESFLETFPEETSLVCCRPDSSAVCWCCAPTRRYHFAAKHYVHLTLIKGKWTAGMSGATTSFRKQLKLACKIYDVAASFIDCIPLCGTMHALAVESAVQQKELVLSYRN